MTHKPSTTIDDALEADFAEAWRPDAGERLVGTVTAISERAGFEGRSYPIVTIQPDEGEPLAVHAFHGVLMDELAKVTPRIGDRLGVKYSGKVAGGERSYHSYRVVTDRVKSGDSIDWSTYSEDVPAGVHEPLADVERLEAEAATAAALEAEQDERDAALSDDANVPF